MSAVAERDQGVGEERDGRLEPGDDTRPWSGRRTRPCPARRSGCAWRTGRRRPRPRGPRPGRGRRPRSCRPAGSRTGPRAASRPRGRPSRHPPRRRPPATGAGSWPPPAGRSRPGPGGRPPGPTPAGAGAGRRGRRRPAAAPTRDSSAAGRRARRRRTPRCAESRPHRPAPPARVPGRTGPVRGSESPPCWSANTAASSNNAASASVRTACRRETSSSVATTLSGADLVACMRKLSQAPPTETAPEEPQKPVCAEQLSRSAPQLNTRKSATTAGPNTIANMASSDISFAARLAPITGHGALAGRMRRWTTWTATTAAPRCAGRPPTRAATGAATSGPAARALR